MPQKVVQSFLLVYILYLKRCSWVIQCTICDMTLKSSCYIKGSMISTRISEKILWEKFIQDLFYYIALIFCIWLHRAEFIMSIVVQMSDGVHGPLIYVKTLHRMNFFPFSQWSVNWNFRKLIELHSSHFLAIYQSLFSWLNGRGTSFVLSYFEI